MHEKTKILIVEDERITALFLERLLVSNGYIVTDNVSSGEEAIKSVAKNKPVVVLMDIFINGEFDGIETARKINQICKPAIIFTSANTDRIDKTEIIELDKIEFISKPFNKNELLSKIKRFISQ